MGTEGFKGVLLLILMIASLMVPAISTTTVSAPSTFSASPGVILLPTSARANISIKFTVTVTNDYAGDNIDNVLLKAPGFTQPTDLEPTTWTLSTVTDGARFDAIGDNVITPGGSETFVFLWTTPNITTKKDYMISVLVSKEETIYTTYENLGGFMVTIDGKKPTLTINVTQVGVTPVNVVGTALDNAKATITITASETLQSIGPVTVENSGWSEENFLPPISLTTIDNIIYTGTFTVGTWDDNAPVVKVANAKDLVGNENTNMENSFTVDTRAPVFIENGLSTLVSGMRDNVVQTGTGTVFRYVDDSASENMVIIVQDNAVGEADNDYWVNSVTIDATAATRDPTIDSRWTKTITLSEGLNSIVKVTATDRTGNTVSDNVENIFIDTQPPTIEFNTIAGETWDENGELINDNTPEIKITVLDPGYPISGLGVARIAANNDNLRVAIDSDDNVLNGSPYSFENLENKAEWNPSTGVFENLIDNAGKGLANGTYWINVVASDNLAHVGTFTVRASRSFTIDTTKPTSRAPIYIDGNDNFIPANGVTSGSGTEDDPYIIENWDISAENAHGIEIRNTTAYFIIRNCLVENGGFSYDGIYLDNVRNGRMEDCRLANNFVGINLGYSSNNIITNNTLDSNNWRGIHLRYSSNNIMENNNVSNSADGIHLDYSDNNIIGNNITHSNNQDGIKLYNSSNNIVENNSTSNNANGIYILQFSNNNTITNNIASLGNHIGIQLGGDSFYQIYPSNNIIENNDTSNNDYYGIIVDSCRSNNNIITNNHVKSNGWEGIRVHYSSSITLSNNDVNSNTLYGIHLFHSDNNLIANNHVRNNYNYGIYLDYYSDNNLIYHNNIINNVTQAYDNGSNYWDNGYPSGGNYWSDYVGEDNYRSENQDIPGGDGIGDTPYDIPGDNNQDRYPLMNPVVFRWVGVSISETEPTPTPKVDNRFRPTLATARPGENIVTVIRVANLGTLEDTYAISVVDDLGWQIEFSPDNLTIPAGGEDDVTIRITADPAIGNKVQNLVRITATGAGVQATAVLSTAPYFPLAEPPYPLLPDNHPMVRKNPYFYQFSMPSLIVEPPAQPIIIVTENAYTSDEAHREPHPVPFGMGEFPVIAAATEVENGRVIVYGPGASFRSAPTDHFNTPHLRMKELGPRMMGWLVRWENAAQHKVLFYWTPEKLAFHNGARMAAWLDYLRASGYTVHTFSDGITAARLAPYSVFMFVGPERAFTSSEIIAIRDWVQAGGGLFLGEQTDYGGYSKPFYTNPILDALGANITVQDDQVTDNENYSRWPWEPRVYLVDHPVWYPPYAVSAEVSPRVKSVYGGGEGVFTLTVSNDGTEADNYKIDVISTKGWPITLEREEITLPSGQSDNIMIVASAPEVEELTRDVLTVKVTGTGISVEYEFVLIVEPLPFEEIGWIRQFGSSAGDAAIAVAVDTSGNIYVAGETMGALPGQTSSGGLDAFVRKYDGSGSELWTRQFGTSTSDFAQGVVVDTSDNVYVAGYTFGALPGQTSSGVGDAFVRKYDGSGSELWTKQFGTSTFDFAWGVAVDTSDNVYVAGETRGALPGQSSSGGRDAFVRKYDGSGSELWTKQFGSSASDAVRGVAVDTSDNVYVAGFTDGALPGQSSLGEWDAFVRKYDGSGSELWTKQFGSSAEDITYGVAVDTSDNVYVAGFTDGALPGQSSSGGLDAFVRKYDGSGSELWTKQFGSSANDGATGVAVNTPGNVYAAGFTDGALPGQSSSGGFDAFVRKYDGSGSELWTKQFGSSADDGAMGVAVNTPGNVYVAGFTDGALPGQSSSGGLDAFLVKFVQIVRGVEVSVSPSYQSGPPGTTLVYTVTVKNTGSIEDNYTLAVADTENWGLALSENRFEDVQPGENRETTLNVTIPENGIGEWLIIGREIDADILDVHRTVFDPAMHTIALLMDTLLTYDWDMNLIPLLAERYEVTPSYIDFYLRKDVKFHSGDPFNAEAVKYTIERAKNLPGSKHVASVEKFEVEIKDDYWVRVHLEEEDRYALNWFAATSSSIVSPRYAEEYGWDYGVTYFDGTGPFKFKEWIRDKRIVLERNPEYTWGPAMYANRGPARIAGVMLDVIPEDMVRAAALEAGDINFMMPPATTDDLARLNANPEIQLFRGPELAMDYIGFHTGGGRHGEGGEVVKDVRVRQAIAYAIDKEKLIELAVDNIGFPAYGPLTPKHWGYWPGVENYYQYNPERARQLLTEAGYPDGVKIKLLAMDRDRRVAEALYYQLREVGIDLDYEIVPFGSLEEAVRKREHQMYLLGWNWPYEDILFWMFHPDRVPSPNRMWWDHENVESVIDRTFLFDDDEALEALYELQQIIMEDVVWVPWRVREITQFARAEVKGYQLHPWPSWTWKLLDVTVDAVPSTKDNVTVVATSQTDNTVSAENSAIAHAVEPEVENGTVIYPVADVYAFSGYGTGYSRLQLKFDIDNIPSGSNIISAKLWLYRLAADNWDGEILLNRVDDQLWGENLTAIEFDAQTLTTEETRASKFISPGWDYLDVADQLNVDHEAGHTYSSYRLGWANDNGGEPSVGIDDDRFLLIESELDELSIIFSSSEYNGRDPYLEVVYLRPYVVSVSISPTYKSGTLGEELSYTVMVANTGNLDDNYALTVDDNSGWGTTVSPTSLTIAAGASDTATLTVTIPVDAENGTEDNIIVTATSMGNPTVSDSASCIATVTVVRGVEVSVSPENKSGVPGETLTYWITVTNTGNVEETYDLEAIDNADWYLAVSPTSLTIPPNDNGTATLAVTIHEDAENGTDDNIIVTAISQADNAVRDNASCIAHAVGAELPVIEWDALITATFSGDSDDAIFGARADASSGFDSEYDVPEPPAPPEPPYVRAYFYYPEQNPDELHHSYLAPENLMEWPLRIEYADNIENATLTWSVENVPTEYNVLLYRGEDLIADMMAENNYTFEAMSENHDFRVLVGELLPFTLELAQGWNMISFPVLPVNSSPDSIFDSYYVLYRWDAENKRYVLHADSGSFIEPDPIVEVGVGYWAYVLENENVSLLGFPVNRLNLSLRQGWNLIGSTYSVSNIADPIDDPDNSVVNWAFTWDANQRRYVMVQLLEPGKGYWVYALKNCSLVLSNLKLVIVYGIGGRGDLSFNDMAYMGGRRAQHELNVELVEMHSTTETDYIPNLRAAAEDPDTVLIVGVGFDLSEALGTVAQEFPDKNFMGIDTYARFLTPEPLPNLMDVVFEEHNGSALVGVLGALLATHYDHPHIGAVLGVEIPVLWKFEIGYKWGCDWAMSWYENNFPENYATEPDNSIVKTPKKERVLWTYTGTFTDITKGYEAAKPMYEKGAVAVYNIAGPLGLGINSAVKEIAKAENLENGPPFWIGVDADQDWINPGFVIASMMKRVDHGVYCTTELVLGNKFRDAVQECDGTIRLGIGTEILGIPMEGISVSALDDLDAFLWMGIEAGIIDPEDRDAIYAKVKAMRETQPSWIWEAVGELESRIRIDMENVPEVDTTEEIDYWRGILG